VKIHWFFHLCACLIDLLQHTNHSRQSDKIQDHFGKPDGESKLNEAHAVAKWLPRNIGGNYLARRHPVEPFGLKGRLVAGARNHLNLLLIAHVTTLGNVRFTPKSGHGSERS